MSLVSPFVTRRRFLAFLSGAPMLLLLTRCAPIRRDADGDTYDGPFFSDGTGLIE